MVSIGADLELAAGRPWALDREVVHVRVAAGTRGSTTSGRTRGAAALAIEVVLAAVLGSPA